MYPLSISLPFPSLDRDFNLHKWAYKYIIFLGEWKEHVVLVPLKLHKSSDFDWNMVKNEITVKSKICPHFEIIESKKLWNTYPLPLWKNF